MTSVYSLGTSNNDVQNLSDVQRPSTLLEKFFFQIMDEVESGNESVINRLLFYDDLFIDTHIELNNIKGRLYTDYGWESRGWGNNGDPLDNYVHDVIQPDSYNTLTTRDSFELKCEFLSIFRNEKWFRKNIDEVVFQLIEEYNESETFSSSGKTLRIDYRGHLDKDRVEKSLWILRLRTLKNEIEEWYKVFQKSLPKSKNSYDGRVKHFFTLTDEQRNDLWEKLVKRPLLDGDGSHYKDFLTFTNSEFPYYVETMKGTSVILNRLLLQRVEENNEKGLIGIVNHVMGTSGMFSMVRDPL